MALAGKLLLPVAAAHQRPPLVSPLCPPCEPLPVTCSTTVSAEGYLGTTEAPPTAMSACRPHQGRAAGEGLFHLGLLTSAHSGMQACCTAAYLHVILSDHFIPRLRTVTQLDCR